jgi:tetratricopeptide (TPR) repeat protein
MRPHAHDRSPLGWLGHPGFWFGVAFVVRLAYLSSSADSVLFSIQLLDERETAETARGLLRGEGFGAEPLFKAPLYSMIVAATMAVTGDLWYWALRLVQHALGALLVVLGFDVARRLAGPGTRGQLAGALTAAFLTLHAPLVRLENRLVLDFFSVFWQSALLWALVCGMSAGARVRMRWILGAGAFAALAWLTRPTLTPVLPLLAVWVGWGGWRPGRAGRLVHAALFLALPLAAMGLVGLRNATAGGEWRVLPWQGGYNFYHANAPGMSGRYLVQARWAYDAAGNPTRRHALDEFAGAVARGEVSEPAANARFGAVDAWWFGRARTAIAADPAAWLGLMARKALYLVSDREIYNFEDYTVQRELSLFLRLLPGRFGVVWPWALASLAMAGLLSRGRRRALVLVWGTAVATAGAIGLYYTSGRMRMPLVFPAAVLAGAGLAVLALHVAARGVRGPRALAFGGLVLIGAAMSWGDWWGVRSENVRHGEYLRLSNAAFFARRYDEALDFARRAEAERPGLAQAIQLRAQASYGLGDLAGALEGFREAANAQPADPVAPMNIGVILLHDLGRAEQALPHFEEALRRDARYRASAWHAAFARLRLGDAAGAAALLAPDLPPRPDAPARLLKSAAALACAQGDTAAARSLARQLETNHGIVAGKELDAEMQLLGLECR